jgi:molecular chaperone GrpE (heat shock protein)
MMADDRHARIAELEAENAALRERDAAAQAEIAGLRGDLERRNVELQASNRQVTEALVGRQS